MIMYVDNEDVISKIRKLDEEVTKEINKEDSDKEKIFKLRYAQMIQGLYLTNTMFK